MNQTRPVSDVSSSRRDVSGSGTSIGVGGSTVTNQPSDIGWETWPEQSRVYSCLTPGVPGIGSMTMTFTWIKHLLKMNAQHAKPVESSGSRNVI